MDRFGLGWRAEIAAAIFAHLDRIDVVELIADDHFTAPRRQVEMLQTLARQRPLSLHGVGLGPASTSRVDARRLENLARLRDRLRPESTSEHLAFVRAGGREIGHLAAPPRDAATLDGTLANLDAWRRTLGEAPVMENIASLVDPPGSTLTEAEWLAALLQQSDTRLVLDLHNVHTNSTNFGFDPVEFLARIPLGRVEAIHIAGGRPIGEGRILDDHLHDVPEPVYALLTEVARRAPQPLTVILERDGKYPAITDLLAQLEQARRAVARGRELARTV
jgi:uncharacterized protein (UPF0276 family)